ncbi:MAG: MerR family transcriptional regulator [Cetobacterium sp.]
MFSIGETAKLNKISVQTLHHYDKEGLLKPIHINQDTGYRYYSIDQFLQIDFIKRFKMLGFSLAEIKIILKTGDSLENIQEAVKLQKDIIKKQIMKLESIEKNLEFLEKKIEVGIERKDKKIRIEKFSILKIISSNCEIGNSHDLETKIRKMIIEGEKKYNILDTIIILKVDKNRFETENKTIYTEIIIALNRYLELSENLISIVGNGISLCLESAAFENNIFFNQLIKFGQEKNLLTEDFLYEVYYIAKLDNKNKEYSLLDIIIPLKNL